MQINILIKNSRPPYGLSKDQKILYHSAKQYYKTLAGFDFMSLRFFVNMDLNDFKELTYKVFKAG